MSPKPPISSSFGPAEYEDDEIDPSSPRIRRPPRVEAGIADAQPLLLALLEPLDPRRARLLADPLLDGAHRDGGGSRLPHLDLAVGIVDEDALDAVAELVLLLVTEDFIGNGLGGDRWRPGRAGRHAERREAR